MRPHLSLITTNHNRQKYLENQIKSLNNVLNKQSEIILEHILISTQILDIDNLNLCQNYKIKQINIQLEDNLFNIANARNIGVEHVLSDYIIFIDADCMVGDNFLDEYRVCFDSKLKSVVFTGHAWYMKDGVNVEEYLANSQNLTQYYRPGLDLRSPFAFSYVDNYKLFSSIHFGISKNDFEMSAGFDVKYLGYGCEDTDFGLNLQQKNFNILFNKAEVFHQYHKPSGAPYQSLPEFVNNANYFKSKWGFLPAKAWIDEFVSKNLVYISDNQTLHLN